MKRLLISILALSLGGCANAADNKINNLKTTGTSHVAEGTFGIDSGATFIYSAGASIGGSLSEFRSDLGLGTLATQNGTFSGTSSGTNTGDQTTITGNAGTATALQITHTIGGSNFNGTQDVTTFPSVGLVNSTSSINAESMAATGNIVASAVYAGSNTNITVLSAGSSFAGALTSPLFDISTEDVTSGIALRVNNISTFGDVFHIDIDGKVTATKYNGNAITAGTGTLTLGSATLNAGPGGTLGTAAFTAASTYATAASPTFTGVASFPAGSVGAPSITKTGDADTGIYFPSANQMNVTAGGATVATFNSSGIGSSSYVSAPTILGTNSAATGACGWFISGYTSGAWSQPLVMIDGFTGGTGSLIQCRMDSINTMFDVTHTGVVSASNLKLFHSTLTYSATTDINFIADRNRTVSLTGNITFTTSNRAAGRSVKLRIIGDGSIRSFTFPSWKFVGSSAPANLAANKIAILEITAYGTNDTDVVATYLAEP